MKEAEKVIFYRRENVDLPPRDVPIRTTRDPYFSINSIIVYSSLISQGINCCITAQKWSSKVVPTLRSATKTLDIGLTFVPKFKREETNMRVSSFKVKPYSIDSKKVREIEKLLERLDPKHRNILILIKIGDRRNKNFRGHNYLRYNMDICDLEELFSKINAVASRCIYQDIDENQTMTEYIDLGQFRKYAEECSVLDEHSDKGVWDVVDIFAESTSYKSNGKACVRRKRLTIRRISFCADGTKMRKPWEIAITESELEEGKQREDMGLSNARATYQLTDDDFLGVLFKINLEITRWLWNPESFT